MMSMLKILGVCVTLPLYLDIPGVFGGMSTEVLFLIEKNIKIDNIMEDYVTICTHTFHQRNQLMIT